MALRTLRERQIQSLAYEAGSLLTVIPVCSWLTGEAVAEASILVIAIMIATVFWAQLHNLIFDRIEWALYRRPASDRPARLRLLHAISLETSDTIVTLPLFMVLGGLSLSEALVADIVLTLTSVVYSYAFHWAYDRIRPLRAGRA